MRTNPIVRLHDDPSLLHHRISRHAWLKAFQMVFGSADPSKGMLRTLWCWPAPIIPPSRGKYRLVVVSARLTRVAKPCGNHISSITHQTLGRASIGLIPRISGDWESNRARRSDKETTPWHGLSTARCAFRTRRLGRSGPQRCWRCGFRPPPACQSQAVLRLLRCRLCRRSPSWG